MTPQTASTQESPSDLRIVVGVDGSPCAARALEYAAHQAARTGAWLHVVCAYSILPPEDSLFIPMRLVEAEAAAVVAAAVAYAGDVELTVVAKGQHIFGSPGHVLTEVGEGASELVVGARGLGHADGPLMGSVAEYAANHAPCTTTVVP